MSNFKTKLPLPPQKNNVKVCPVLCTFNTFKLFREANLETEGQAVTRLRKAFLVNTIVITSTGPKKSIH